MQWPHLCFVRKNNKLNEISIQSQIQSLTNRGNGQLWRSFVYIPWSIEFDESIFAIVGDNVIKVLGNGNGDRTIVIAWDWLRFQVWLEKTVLQIVDELFQVVDSTKAIGYPVISNFRFTDTCHEMAKPRLATHTQLNIIFYEC